MGDTMSNVTEQSPQKRDDAPPIAHCGRCGTAFACGVRAGETHCWCFELPSVMALAESVGANCLCPVCLQETIQIVRQLKPYSGG